jgi:hypothetical protein
MTTVFLSIFFNILKYLLKKIIYNLGKQLKN